MMALTQAIVAKTLFDADVSDEHYAIARASNVLAEDFGRRLGLIFATCSGPRRLAGGRSSSRRIFSARSRPWRTSWW
jgi:hypothetical protein